MAPVQAPLFIVGLPRSGTTVFYRRLAQHPDLAWISPATRKHAESYAWCRFRSVFRDDQLPVEASRVWSRFVRTEDDVLEARHVTPAAERYYRAMLANQLRLADASCFLSKHPRNGLRIPFFSAIFPDARFVHLIRDGRAVGESILRCRKRSGDMAAWWDMRPVGWRDQQARSPAAQVGWQWARGIEQIRAYGEALPSDRYIEVHYEAFCEAPVDTLLKVTRFAGLDEARAPWVSCPDIQPQNEKWAVALEPAQIADLEQAAAPVLAQLGYPPSHTSGILG